MPVIAHTLDEALAPITDGCTLLVARETAGVAMAATRALIRRGVKGLNLVTLPTSSLQADMLIGAGCSRRLRHPPSASTNTARRRAFPPPRPPERSACKDATCPALHAAVQAAERGVPFMPLRGVIGSDLMQRRPDWKMVGNPFGEDDPIVLLPAIQRGRRAVSRSDRGPRRQCVDRPPARARHHGACGEEDGRDGREDRRRQPVRRSGAGRRRAFGILHRKRRGRRARRWPLPLPDYYAADDEHLAEYARMARRRTGSRPISTAMSTRAAA